MNITRVKEKFIIVIKLSLRKRQMDYKRASWLQIMEEKTKIGRASCRERVFLSV